MQPVPALILMYEPASSILSFKATASIRRYTRNDLRKDSRCGRNSWASLLIVCHRSCTQPWDPGVKEGQAYDDTGLLYMPLIRTSCISGAEISPVTTSLPTQCTTRTLQGHSLMSSHTTTQHHYPITPSQWTSDSKMDGTPP